jgi:hypothetical protein
MRILAVLMTHYAPKRWRPHSAMGCNGVLCRSWEQFHSVQVCGTSRSWLRIVDLEDVCNDEQRLRLCPDRQNIGRYPHNHRRNTHLAVNWIKINVSEVELGYCREPAGMHQLADWLEKLGLGQYVKRFAENDMSYRRILVTCGVRRQLFETAI